MAIASPRTELICAFQVSSVNTGQGQWALKSTIRKVGQMEVGSGGRQEGPLTEVSNFSTFLGHAIINKVHTQRPCSQASQMAPWIKVFTTQAR